MTSTLQQEASRKLRFTAQTTMRVAQRLYERGYITYMRTDSTTLSETALTAARTQARELYGAGVRPRRAAALRPQGQERAGGARGDPSCGRAVPAPGRRARRARPRRAGALRARLDAHRRLADGGRARADRLAPARRDRGDRRGRRVRRQRHRDHLPRLPGRLRGRPRRGPGRGRGAAVAAPEGRRRGAAALARAAGPRDLAAGPLHGADAGQGAGGLRHRPPVDVRVDPRDDPRPRVRREARAGARADVPGVRRDEAARAALRQARRLRLHRADGGRSRPHRRRRGAAGRLADAVLPRRERRARPARHGHGAPRRDRRPRR